MESPGIDVELGEHEYRIVPQRQARLYRKLFGPKGVVQELQNMDSLFGEESSFDSFFSVISDRLYAVLLVFIPDLMPEWEFEGYGSPTAAENDEYDDEGDRSPTHPQVIEALQTAVQVNGIGWVKKLSGFFDPAMVRAALTTYIAQQVRAQAETSATETGTESRSLPPTNGESRQTSSGTSDPTQSTPSASEETEATVSPSPA